MDHKREDFFTFLGRTDVGVNLARDVSVVNEIGSGVGDTGEVFTEAIHLI